MGVSLEPYRSAPVAFALHEYNRGSFVITSGDVCSVVLAASGLYARGTQGHTLMDLLCSVPSRRAAKVPVNLFTEQRPLSVSCQRLNQARTLFLYMLLGKTVNAKIITVALSAMNT